VRAYDEPNGLITLLSDGERLTGAYHANNPVHRASAGFL